MAELSTSPVPDAQLFRDAFNASPIGIAVENLDGQPLFVNPAFCKFLAFTEKELCSKHCVDFSPREDAEKDWELFQQLKAGSIDHYQMEKRYFRRDGSLVWGSLSISLLKGRSSPLVLAMVEDITDKKNAEEELRSSEERLRLAAQIGKMYAYSWDVITDEVVRSPEYVNVLGVSDQERFTRHQLLEKLHPDDRATWIASAADLTPDNPTCNVTYRVLRPDGSEVWLEKNARAFFDTNGRMLRVIGMVADVTKRKAAERELALAHERLHLAMEAAGAGGWDFDVKTGRNLWFGKAHAQLGMTPDETKGSNNEFWDRVHKDDRERVEHALQVAKEKREECVEDFRVIWRNGTTRWLRARGRFHYAENGEADRFLGISLDVTEKKQAEQALRESEEQFRTLAEAIPQLCWMARADGYVFWYNQRWYTYTGTTPEQMQGWGWQLVHDPKTLPSVLQQWKAAISTGEPSGMIFPLRGADGVFRPFLTRVVPLKDAEGHVVRWFGTDTDITELRDAQEAQRISEERLRLAQQAARIGTFEWNIRTGANTWTPELETMYGLPPGGFGGTQAAFKNLLHPDDRARVMKLADISLKTAQPTTGEWRVIWPDGSVHWIASRWQVFMDDSGEPSRMLGVNMDVTERKLAEDRLREYEKTVEGAEDMIGVIDRDYRFVLANRQYLKMRNMTMEQVIGRSVPEVLNKEVFEKVVKPKLDECFQGKVVRYEEKFSYPMVGERRLLLSYFPIEDVNGKIDRAACILHDITERKQAEEVLSDMSGKLIDAQEQERTRIARELHDDINQRLALLSVELEASRQNPPDTATDMSILLTELREHINGVSFDVQSISHRLHSSQLEYLGIVAAARSFCREFSTSQKIEVDFSHDDIPSSVPHDISLCLFRVLQEALHNAAKYSQVRHIEVRLSYSANYVGLTVSDRGVGFDPEAALARGGLGLTSMKERVRLINGTISIESKPMHGTTIHVRAPLTSEHRSEELAG